MSVAQTLAARRRWRDDGRYKPKKGSRAGAYANKSQRRAATKMRKRVNAGGIAGSIGGRAK